MEAGALKMPRRANLLYIFQTGYGFVQLPLGLFSFATTIYYLLVNNVTFLKTIFPEFWMFLVVGGVVGIPSCLTIGQLYLMSELNKASTRVHPYSTLLIPTQIPSYRVFALAARQMGDEALAAEIEALIKRSEKF